MHESIQSKVPALITAGDSLAWRINVPGHSANDGWVLKHRFINSAAKFDITSTADGEDHLVNVAASVSATYAPGTYARTDWVEKGAERYTVGSGSLIVKPDLAAVSSAGYDTRSAAQQALDALKAALQTYVSSRGHVAEYQIAGRVMKFRNAMEIEQQIQFWQREVAAEERAERLAKGLPSRNRILVRFPR